jgi:ABC-2 type transport system permease protein
MELRRSLKSFLIWSIAMGLTMYLIVALYPVVGDMYAALPEEFMDYFGGLPKNIIEYFGVEGAMMLQLMGSIFAVILGFNAINREFNELSIDTIYSLPISRSEFYINKLIASVIQVIAFMVVNILFVILGFVTANEVPHLGTFFAFMAINTLLLLMMLVMGFALAIVVKRGVKAMVSLAIPLPLYIIFFVYQLSDNKFLGYLKHITPFSFADPAFFFKEDVGFAWQSLIVFSIISLISLLYSFKIYKQKDLLT